MYPISSTNHPNSSSSTISSQQAVLSSSSSSSSSAIGPSKWKDLSINTVINNKNTGYTNPYPSKILGNSSLFTTFYGLSTPPSSSSSSSSSSFETSSAGNSWSSSSLSSDKFIPNDTIVTPIIKKGNNNPSFEDDYTSILDTVPSHQPSFDDADELIDTPPPLPPTTATDPYNPIVTCVPGRGTTDNLLSSSFASSSYASVTLNNTYHNTYHTRSQNTSSSTVIRSSKRRKDPIVRFDTPLTPEEVEAAKLADEKKRQTRLQYRQQQSKHKHSSKVRLAKEVPKEENTLSSSSSSSAAVSFPSSVVENPDTLLPTSSLPPDDTTNNDEEVGSSNNIHEMMTNDPPSTNRSQDTCSDDRLGDSFDRYFGNSAVQQLVKDIQSGDLHERTKAAKYNSTLMNTIRNSTLGSSGSSSMHTTNNNGSNNGTSVPLRGNLFRSRTSVHQLPTTEITTITTTPSGYNNNNNNTNISSSSSSSSPTSGMNDTSESFTYLSTTGTTHSPNRSNPTSSTSSVSPISPNRYLLTNHSPNRNGYTNNHSNNSSLSSSSSSSSFVHNSSNTNLNSRLTLTTTNLPPPASPSLVSPNPRSLPNNGSTNSGSNNGSVLLPSSSSSSSSSASVLLGPSTMHTPASDRARRLVAIGASTNSATAIPVINMLATRNSVNSKLLSGITSFSSSSASSSVASIVSATKGGTINGSSNGNGNSTATVPVTAHSNPVPGTSASTTTATVAAASTPSIAVTSSTSGTSVPPSLPNTVTAPHTESIASNDKNNTHNESTITVANTSITENEPLPSTDTPSSSSAVRKLSYSDDAVPNDNEQESGTSPLCDDGNTSFVNKESCSSTVTNPAVPMPTVTDSDSGQIDDFTFVPDSNENEEKEKFRTDRKAVISSIRSYRKRKITDAEPTNRKDTGKSMNDKYRLNASPAAKTVDGHGKKKLRSNDDNGNDKNTDTTNSLSTVTVSPSTSFTDRSSVSSSSSTTTTPSPPTTVTTPLSSLVRLSSPRSSYQGPFSTGTLYISSNTMATEATPSVSVTSSTNMVNGNESFSYISPPSIATHGTDGKPKQPPVKPSTRKILSKLLDDEDDEEEEDKDTPIYGGPSSMLPSLSTTTTTTSATISPSSLPHPHPNGGYSSLNNLLSPRSRPLYALSNKEDINTNAKNHAVSTGLPDTRRILFNSPTDGMNKNSHGNGGTPDDTTIATSSSASTINTTTKNSVVTGRKKMSTLRSTLTPSSTTTPTSTNSDIRSSLSEFLNTAVSSTSTSSYTTVATASSSTEVTTIPSSSVRPTRQARDPVQQNAFRNQYVLLGTRPTKVTNTVLSSTLNNLLTTTTTTTNRNSSQSSQRTRNNRSSTEIDRNRSNPPVLSFEELLLSNIRAKKKKNSVTKPSVHRK